MQVEHPPGGNELVRRHWGRTGSYPKPVPEVLDCLHARLPLDSLTCMALTSKAPMAASAGRFLPIHSGWSIGMYRNAPLPPHLMARGVAGVAQPAVCVVAHALTLAQLVARVVT